jgi:hypothetical protein
LHQKASNNQLLMFNPQATWGYSFRFQGDGAQLGPISGLCPAFDPKRAKRNRIPATLSAAPARRPA